MVTQECPHQSNLDVRIHLTFERNYRKKMFTQINAGVKQLAERFADISPPTHHEQHVYYAYEPTDHEHDHASSKHHYGGGHKNNAAMSALTLLAFLFFLHILQQCIKDHMNSMTNPQLMIMTTSREGEQLMTKTDKLDKTGTSENMENRENIEVKQNEKSSRDPVESQLTRITTVHTPKTVQNSQQKYPGFINAMMDDY